MTNQPDWKCVANLGDATPWEYGGAFVMVDQTGVYCPELWYIPDPDEDYPTEYRILLEPCTYTNGILSDNKYHPEVGVWFSDQPRLFSLARSAGCRENELIEGFCSDDPIERARAYLTGCEYYGAFEFDQYPVQIGDKEKLRKRMEKWLRQIGA